MRSTRQATKKRVPEAPTERLVRLSFRWEPMVPKELRELMAHLAPKEPPELKELSQMSHPILAKARAEAAVDRPDHRVLEAEEVEAAVARFHQALEPKVEGVLRPVLRDHSEAS